MRFPSCFALLSALAHISHVSSLASTDTIQDMDPGQSGYLPNHNMDPAVVDSAQFGQLWKQQFNNLELFYAKPLVYTPNAGGPQLLLLASSQNWIRSLNAKTGALINSRLVATPFLQSDIACTDIPNTIGIIGTPVIDPATDIMYFYAKSYIPNYRSAGNTGTYNGVYYFYAVDVNTLEDVSGFPILVDGSVSDNDASKYFIGGTILQRPSLIQIGSMVYGAFGGHCDLFNYTGLVLGVDINLKKVVTNFALESGPLAPQTNNWQDNSGGGQGGIWMSGMGLSTDGDRLFLVSGNGDGHENIGTPATGASGCKTLGEACVNLGIGAGGKLHLNDYFQPYDYQNMDGGDQDFGSGGITLLDPTVFKGTGVSKMAVTAGKNGKIYILDANNLGGYKMGPGQTDGIIQTITTNEAVFGGSGSYPLEGGYIYSTPVGFPTYVYKLGFSNSGVPVFIPAGATTEASAGRVGVGIPTITSYQGKAGTAILWMCDPDAGLRAWYAVPQADGTMKRINLPQVNGLNKFQRPVFGDTRLYVSDNTGGVYCLGSPVNLPLNCSSPIDFGNVALGSSQTEQVHCTANIAITQITQVSVGDEHFQVNQADLPQGAISAGQTFSFPVTWNLTHATASNAVNASYGNVSPGVKSTALTLTTNNAVAGYSTSFPISLTGNEVSNNAFLVIAPITVDYGGVVILDPDNVPTNSLPFTISNAGLSELTILRYAYTTDDLGDDDINYTNATIVSNGTTILGDSFVAQSLPEVGTVIPGNGQISVQSSFSPCNGTGNYNSYLTVWTTGGTQSIILEGSGSTAPIANFSISTNEGGWLPPGNLDMDFGDVIPGTTPSLQIRICNQGGSVLEIDKSKPPNGVFRIDDPTELHESQDISIGDCAYGTVLFTTNVEKPNTPDQFYQNTWTLNTNDLNFGVHVVNITGSVISQKIGPTNTTHQPVYTYLGCYDDDAPAGRLLPDQAYLGNLNENGLCQDLCYNDSTGPYVFAGTEYQTECFCGNKPPGSAFAVDDSFCTFACQGDDTQVCGGVGGYLSVYYDSSRFTPSNDSTGPIGGPSTVNQTGNFNYIGCYSDNDPGRALTGLVPAVPDEGNTVDNCATRCSGYEFFGTEYSNECYCGNAIEGGSVLQISTDPTVNGCGMKCGGDLTEYCGGPNRLNMYQVNGSLPIPTTTSAAQGSTPTATGGPSVVPSAAGFSYIGCYTEATDGRALSGVENPVGGSLLTVPLCAAACKGYAFMGLEYSGECYCGNTLNDGSAIAPGGSDPTQNMCNMVCDGDQTTYCGGPNRLTMYAHNSSLVPSSSMASASASATPAGGPIVVPAVGGYNYLGCYTEATTGRALSDLENPITGAGMTVEACSAACRPYRYFGVEYSGECYCGNQWQSGAVVAPGGNDPTQNQCNMLCNGNQTEYCGGPNRLNAYVYNASSVPSTISTASSVSSTFTTTSVIAISTASVTTISTASVATTSTASVTTISTASVATTSTASVATISTASVTTISTASVATISTASVATISTASVATTSTASVATISTASVATISTASVATTSTASVTTTSTASVATISTASVTTISTASVTTISTASPTPTGPVTVGNSSTFAYLGCYTDNTANRGLTGLANPGNVAQNSVEACAIGCNAFQYFGVEYGGECYCGNAIVGESAIAPGSTPADTQCDMPCNGNTTEFCGGRNRLNIYSKLGNGLHSSSSNVLSSTTTITATSSGSLSAHTTTSSSATPSPTGPIHVPKVGNYAYAGCWNESAAGPSGVRTLNSAVHYDDANMTIEECAASCAGYPWFGVEYYHECYCGESPSSGSANVSLNDCSFVCPGNSLEYCGAGNRLDMYHLIPSLSTASASSMMGSTILATSMSVSSTGSTSISASVGPTSSTLSSSSSSKSASLSSTSSSSVSSSASSVSSTSSLASSTSARVSSSATTSTSSFITSTSTSIVSTSSLASPTSTSVSSSATTSTSSFITSTSTSIVSTSSLASSTSAGVSSSVTTSTSSFITSTSTSVVSTSSATASSSSSTSNAISSTTITSSSSGILSASSSLSSSSSSGSSSAAINSPTPGTISSNGWSYLGCANDSTTARSLTGAYRPSSSMTVETCQAYCSGSTNNYGLAGLEYGSQCFCGNGLQNYGAIVKASSCSTPCAGNASEICGAGGFMSLYNLTSYVPPTTVKQVGTYLSQGCYNEKPNGRILNGPSYTNDTGMTVESCVNYCSSKGSNFAGVEYATQCFCGSSLGSATQASNQDSCNKLCSGNNREFCGGNALLNIYMNTPNSVSSRGVPSTANTNNAATVKVNSASSSTSKREVLVRGGFWQRFRFAAKSE